MRGLPFTSTEADIAEWFNQDLSLHISPLDHNSCVHIWQRARRATGIAIVEFPSSEEATAALTKNMQSMGSRYIELFPATLLDLHYFQKQNQVTLSKLAQE
ncbi:MAG: hypothetical protein WDW36_004663 [Sanguina aurantia]